MGRGPLGGLAVAEGGPHVTGDVTSGEGEGVRGWGRPARREEVDVAARPVFCRRRPSLQGVGAEGDPFIPNWEIKLSLKPTDHVGEVVRLRGLEQFS